MCHLQYKDRMKKEERKKDRKLVITMASYALQKPARVAHEKPPGPKGSKIQSRSFKDQTIISTTSRLPENIFCPSPEFFYLKLSMKARELKSLSTRDISLKCNILSLFGDNFLSQTICFCHRQFPHELSNYKNCFCHK